ncbi:MAG: LysE family translocator [Pseudomonadota bacterium]
MTLETYLAYLAVVAVFFATPPGPSQILIISTGMQHGLKPSFATMAGDLSANALQMTAAAFGLAAVIATSAGLLEAVKWAGVAYLVYVGIRTFRAAPPRLADGNGKTPRGMLFRRGFITSASNPKAVFFFAALFPQFIDPTVAIWPQLLILGVTYLVVDGTILTLYSAFAERVGDRLRGTLSGWINKLSGVMMIAAACLLALKDVEVRPAR